MAEIIPNTSDVRHAYIDFISFYNQMTGVEVDDEAAGRAFDTWLNNVETVARQTRGENDD